MILGHADIRTTVNIYMEVLPSLKQDAIGQLAFACIVPPSDQIGKIEIERGVSVLPHEISDVGIHVATVDKSPGLTNDFDPSVKVRWNSLFSISTSSNMVSVAFFWLCCQKMLSTTLEYELNVVELRGFEPLAS